MMITYQPKCIVVSVLTLTSSLCVIQNGGRWKLFSISYCIGFGLRVLSVNKSSKLPLIQLIYINAYIVQEAQNTQTVFQV